LNESCGTNFAAQTYSEIIKTGVLEDNKEVTEEAIKQIENVTKKDTRFKVSYEQYRQLTMCLLQTGAS